MSAFQHTLGDTFTLPAYLHAETIHLVGEFNGWNRYSHPFLRTATGQWTIGWPRPARWGRFYLLLDRTRWLTVDSIDFLFLERWHALPASTLFIWAGQAMTIGQFLAWIERWCDTLVYTGVAKGAVVALPPVDSPIAMALWLALFRRQAIVVPLVQNTRRSCPPRSMSPAFSTNDWPVPVEWLIEWQADDAARYIRYSTTTAHRTIQHLRSLGHPGLLYHTRSEQRQFRIIDLIDYWMPDAFHRLRQAGQSGFSSAVQAILVEWIVDVGPAAHLHQPNLAPFLRHDERASRSLKRGFGTSCIPRATVAAMEHFLEVPEWDAET
jgi:hypothetical protein